jgi:hypothetical protein
MKSRLLRFVPLLILFAFVGAVAWRLSRPAERKSIATGWPAGASLHAGAGHCWQARPVIG